MLKECETVELKKSLAQLKEGVISLSAMLNKTSKGEVYFGIKDEGEVVGLDVGKKTIADITHEIQNNLKPLPIKVLINEVKMENKSIIKVYVEGQDKPYSAYDRYYIRVNDADIIMNSLVLQHFFEQKQDNYSLWEKAETKYTIDDVDEELLIDFVRTANEKGRVDYLYRNAKDTLIRLGLLTENDKLNNAGVYLFGKMKPIMIKEASYPTDSRVDFGEIKQFKGNIFECIREATSYIQNHISFRSDIVGLQREDISEIPLRAIREIVVNSFAHANYAISNDNNQYIVYRSSVRIYNPGSIYQNIDPERFASGSVGSKIRNVLIASTLFKYGLIDAFGTGFDRTFTLCAKEEIDYRYINDEFGFTFIFERKKNFLRDDEYIKDDRLDKLDEEIINFLYFNENLTIPQLALKTGKSEPTIHRHLDYLASLNKIKRIGSRKKGYWKVIE